MVLARPVMSPMQTWRMDKQAIGRSRGRAVPAEANDAGLPGQIAAVNTAPEAAQALIIEVAIGTAST